MYYKIKDLDINCEIFGEGKPIIIIHGSHVDHRLMTGCMEPVFRNRNEYKRIYIDLPGMGKSKSQDWIINSDVMLDIVIEIIEKVIPNKNFLLAGESYGGYLARGIIHKMKERVVGSFLLCPAIILDSSKRNVPPHTVIKTDEYVLSMLEPKDAEDFADIQVVQTKEVLKRYKAEILSGLRIADNNFLDNLQTNGYSFTFEEEMSKEQFNKPTLFMLGRQDSCVGYKDAWDILDNYPRATFAVLDMAGHNLQIEQVELFNSLVNEWLGRIGEFM